MYGNYKTDIRFEVTQRTLLSYPVNFGGFGQTSKVTASLFASLAFDNGFNSGFQVSDKLPEVLIDSDFRACNQSRRVVSIGVIIISLRHARSRARAKAEIIGIIRADFVADHFAEAPRVQRWRRAFCRRRTKWTTRTTTAARRRRAAWRRSSSPTTSPSSRRAPTAAAARTGC